MKMSIEIQPWEVPTHVKAVMPPGLRQDGIQSSPKWPLESVDAETLAKLCDKFRIEVFVRAGKIDPSIAESKDTISTTKVVITPVIKLSRPPGLIINEAGIKPSV